MSDNEIITRYKRRNHYKVLRHPITGRVVNPQYLRFLSDENLETTANLRKREQYLTSTVEISLQGEVLAAKCHKLLDRPVSGGVRGRIRGFSNKSRKNMLDTVSRIDWTNKTAQFITLTYHSNMTNAQRAKRDLRAFLKRLYRRYGNCPSLWKLEPQKRGAWHFHLLIWDLPFIPLSEILEHWREVTTEQTITQVKIEPVQSARKARSYVSKYLGKQIDDAFLRWFVLFLLRCPAWQVFALALDYLPNLAATVAPGRFWGIENRKNVQWAELIAFSIMLDQSFYDFKRAARRSWHGINTNKWQGFTLYVRNPARWHEYLFYIIGEVEK